MIELKQFIDFRVGGMAESTQKRWYEDVIDELVASGQTIKAEKLAEQFIEDYESNKGIRNPE